MSRRSVASRCQPDQCRVRRSISNLEDGRQRRARPRRARAQQATRRNRRARGREARLRLERGDVVVTVGRRLHPGRTHAAGREPDHRPDRPSFRASRACSSEASAAIRCGSGSTTTGCLRRISPIAEVADALATRERRHSVGPARIEPTPSLRSGVSGELRDSRGLPEADRREPRRRCRFGSKDIARVEVGPEDVRKLVRFSGLPAIGLGAS